MAKSQIQIDNSIYDTLGERWYSAYDDPVALLRAEAKAELPWIMAKIKRLPRSRSTRLLDVGCGGGFLSNAFAGEGLQVTAIDTSRQSLEVARRYDKTRSVNYRWADAYALPFADDEFDAVTCMDFLEHVEQPARVIQQISRVLKTGGLFFFHTFNRNPVAHLLVIKLIERLVRNTPKNMHVIDLFLKPAEVRAHCRANGLHVAETTGLRPDFTSIPLKSYFSGVVPESLRFKLCHSEILSYMGYAVKVGGS